MSNSAFIGGMVLGAIAAAFAGSADKGYAGYFGPAFYAVLFGYLAGLLHGWLPR